MGWYGHPQESDSQRAARIEDNRKRVAAKKAAEAIDPYRQSISARDIEVLRYG